MTVRGRHLEMLSLQALVNLETQLVKHETYSELSGREKTLVSKPRLNKVC